MMAAAMAPLLTRRQRWILGAVRFFFVRGAPLVGWFIKLLAGGLSGPFLTAMLSMIQENLVLARPAAVESGRARDVLAMEGAFARAAATIRPDSQWTFRKEPRGPLIVMVLPRVIDSNTGVVLSSSDLSAGQPGDVVTFDGLPPNCDPPALNHILYGPTGPLSAVVAGVGPAPGALGDLPRQSFPVPSSYGNGVSSDVHISDSEKA